MPKPKTGKKAVMSLIKVQEIAVGKGLQDSSSSIIPLLKIHVNSDREFILLSTGTWIMCMNPFSGETLTSKQLKNDFFCFMTTDKR